ncbi:hypothetical protein ACSYAD_34050 [Acaryochloris marina NIES-2412]|uniref:hypothetical protein n=1 Tax=Acaryochloris marina TaxID=155978 RepID=UPI0040581A8F
MPPKITYAYVWANDQIRVDAAVECGKRFEGIAWIIDPNSTNPSLRLDQPLGTGAVQAIMDRTKVGFPSPTV